MQVSKFIDFCNSECKSVDLLYILETVISYSAHCNLRKEIQPESEQRTYQRIFHVVTKKEMYGVPLYSALSLYFFVSQ